MGWANGLYLAGAVFLAVIPGRVQVAGDTGEANIVRSRVR